MGVMLLLMGVGVREASKVGMHALTACTAALASEAVQTRLPLTFLSCCSAMIIWHIAPTIREGSRSCWAPSSREFVRR
eukprot:3635937-Prymnesium_polylepis.1